MKTYGTCQPVDQNIVFLMMTVHFVRKKISKLTTPNSITCLFLKQISPTFLENIVWSENPSVANKALHSPKTSKAISVTVAIQTPPIIGMSDKYTWNENSGRL